MAERGKNMATHLVMSTNGHISQLELAKEPEPSNAVGDGFMIEAKIPGYRNTHTVVVNTNNVDWYAFVNSEDANNPRSIALAAE